VTGRAPRDRFRGHAEHHARLLRLGDRDRPGVLEREHPISAVGAHSGQQERHGRHATQARGRMEQHVD